MLNKLKSRFAKWLLKDVHLDEIHIGERSVVISGTGINMDGQKIENVGAPDSDDDVPRRVFSDLTGRWTLAQAHRGALNKIMVFKGPGTDPVEEDKPAAGGLAIYGDGSDGDITIDSDTTLTRDMFYNTLTINATKTLSTKGYRVFVKGTLTNNGTIENSGSNGDNSGTPAPGGGEGTVGGGGNGGAAIANGPGGGGGGGGVVVIAAKTINNGSGTIKANGGNGANALTNYPGGDCQAGVAGRCGGSGGKGGNTSLKTGCNGGTSATIYSNYRAALTAILGWETKPTAGILKGGSGGGEGASDYSPDGNGGGGGGGGGVVVLIYNSLTTGTEEATKGTGGAGSGDGSAGADGEAGIVIKIANV